jgi:hypothetical protein
MLNNGPRFDEAKYFSQFSHLFSEDVLPLLDLLDDCAFHNKFEDITSEDIKKAFPLYRDAVSLSGAFSVYSFNEQKKFERTVHQMERQLNRFFECYCRAMLLDCLSETQPPKDIQIQLKEYLSFKQKLKRREIAIQFAEDLYFEFLHACTETDMQFFSFYPPAMGSPDENTISLEWAEFALDKCGKQYVISEYTVDKPSCIYEEEFLSKDLAFNALKTLARKYYVYPLFP